MIQVSVEENEVRVSRMIPGVGIEQEIPLVKVNARTRNRESRLIRSAALLATAELNAAVKREVNDTLRGMVEKAMAVLTDKEKGHGPLCNDCSTHAVCSKCGKKFQLQGWAEVIPASPPKEAPDA